MQLELMGRKLGMTQIFREDGQRVPVTILEIGPCTVVQKRSANESHAALQLGYQAAKAKHLTKAERGHLEKRGVPLVRHLYEHRIKPEELDEVEIGQELALAAAFENVEKVDVTGVSKGRGFTGVIKRHNFAKAKMTHGTHEFFRHAGAVGAGTYPGRIWKGKKMAGQSGNARVTAVGLRVERVDAEKNLLFVRGAVPGHRRGLVRVRPSTRSE